MSISTGLPCDGVCIAGNQGTSPTVHAADQTGQLIAEDPIFVPIHRLI